MGRKNTLAPLLQPGSVGSYSMGMPNNKITSTA